MSTQMMDAELIEKKYRRNVRFYDLFTLAFARRRTQARVARSAGATRHV